MLKILKKNKGENMERTENKSALITGKATAIELHDPGFITIAVAPR